MVNADKHWSERIPAAIARGEEHVNSAEHRHHAVVMGGELCAKGITAGEVALAKALWELHVRAMKGRLPMPPSLIAFTEKIEQVSHD